MVEGGFLGAELGSVLDASVSRGAQSGPVQGDHDLPHLKGRRCGRKTTEAARTIQRVGTRGRAGAGTGGTEWGTRRGTTRPDARGQAWRMCLRLGRTPGPRICVGIKGGGAGLGVRDPPGTSA